jgi:uncharacterized protein YcfJ
MFQEKGMKSRQMTCHVNSTMTLSFAINFVKLCQILLTGGLKMKKLFIAVIAIVASMQAFGAMKVRLNSDARVYRDYDRREFVTLLRNTIVVVDNRSFDGFYRLRKVKNIGNIRSDYRYNAALTINRDNRDRRGIVYKIPSYIINNSLDNRRQDRRNDRRVVTTTTTRRNGGTTVTTTRRNYDTNVVTTTRTREYEVCYEQPRKKVVTINESQRQRGNNRVGWGLVGALGGQVLGEITGERDLGNIVSAIGAGFVVAGAIDLSQSKETIFETQYNCRQYYEVDEYLHEFYRNSQRCTTTRYYTYKWGEEREYFETSCIGNGRSNSYMSFQRSQDIWY